MPRLAKILTEADLLHSTGEGRTDLTPYIEIIEEVARQGGVGGDVQLAAGENQRKAKRRLSIAAKQRDMKLIWRKPREGGLRFVISLHGSSPPGDPRIVSGVDQTVRSARRSSERQMDNMRQHLAATFGTADAAEAWLHDPNRYLGGATPNDMIRSGRLDRVEAALTVLDSGIFI